MKQFAFALVALAFATLGAAPASADLYTFNGDNTGGPTWNRPLSGLPPTNLSAVGTAVPYETFEFSVDTAGSYNFLMTGISPLNWDTFLALYENSFDPTAQFTNVLAANDDYPSIGISGFDVDLSTGVTYIAVATSFANDQSGTYTLDIRGPGSVVEPGGGAVPEPATWALMILGFGAAGATLRRRRAVTA